MAHNGEINTLRGSIAVARAKHSSPICSATTSENPAHHQHGRQRSAMFDNCLEMLVMSGRSLPHAVMMMIPNRGESRKHVAGKAGFL